MEGDGNLEGGGGKERAQEARNKERTKGDETGKSSLLSREIKCLLSVPLLLPTSPSLWITAFISLQHRLISFFPHPFAFSGCYVPRIVS